MYASHRDACILAKYSYELGLLLEQIYKSLGLENSVIAYRRLGKANYHFSADAAKSAMDLSPCMVLCFDITGFFDNLDHKILKSRLKEILSVTEIPDDWYKVFRHVTAYRKIERADLSAHPDLALRMKSLAKEPVATIADVKSLGIKIHENPNDYGIPQGTPISSSFSNLYMLHVDLALKNACSEYGALYQRYSDDIIIICKPDAESKLTALLMGCIAHHKLIIQPEKCEQILFDALNPKSFQYLGFDVSPKGAVIRASSLSKQWRKLRKNIAKAKKHGGDRLASGSGSKIFTKKLRRKFYPIGVRNFSRYGRRSAASFESSQIRQQLIKLEREADRAIRDLNPKGSPPKLVLP